MVEPNGRQMLAVIEVSGSLAAEVRRMGEEIERLHRELAAARAELAARAPKPRRKGR